MTGSDLLAEVRRLRAATDTVTVVLDDDPTGSQTVHGVEVVLVPEPSEVLAGLNAGKGTVFVWTNTRSLDRARAVELNEALAEAVLRHHTGDAPVQLVSRSDSTLRGHVTAEIDALATARHSVTGRTHDAVLFVPAFPEAGRITRNGMHLARIDGAEVPVSETEFARDATFGYRNSQLAAFLAEVSAGSIARSDVRHIPLTMIRGDGAEAIAELLRSASGAWVVADAVTPEDLNVLALGSLLAESRGATIAYRSAPSFVRPLLGIPDLHVVTAEQLRTAPDSAHGLLVVGSHTALTTRQLARAQEESPFQTVELDVRAVMDDSAAAIHSAAVTLATSLRRSDTVLMTSRDLMRGATPQSSLEIARTVSAALAAVVDRVVSAAPPAWVILKGGITSHDVAVDGLRVCRAQVLGQVLPGQISILQPSDTASDTGGYDHPFVIFPGNVGDPNALAAAVQLLRSGTR